LKRNYRHLPGLLQKLMPALNPAEAGQAPGNYTYRQTLAGILKTTHETITKFDIDHFILD
jgi:hypothetical protein